MSLNFSLSVGSSRLQKTYKVQQWDWDRLAERLKRVKRTEETMAEYAAMTKDQKSAAKDAGAFIGGELEGGSRKKVISRQLVCLDVDYATPDFMELWRKIWNRRALLYPTHSSTPDKPRYRLVVPLARAVPTEQYQPIARMIACKLGMELFDDTTYEPQRIMYWPSVPKDAPYQLLSCAGPVFDPDEVLAMYQDWRDVSEWPFSQRSEQIRHRTEKKMQAVAEKRGVVGAFVRAWPIEECIAEFVPDYVPGTLPGRYTYAPGSTANGVVVYDGQYTYSHHDTDPASGVECNAFDLVRLHRFKNLDEDVRPGLAITQRPSYKAMIDFALTDDRTLGQLQQEQAAEAEETAAAFDDESAADSTSWEKKLERDRTGWPISSYRNIEAVLANDKKFAGKLGFDEFAQKEVALSDLPWRQISRRDAALRDIDDAEIRLWLGKKYHITGKDKIWDCVQHECHKRTFHPIRKYLEGLTWDGEPRIDTVLIDYFGCEDCGYIRAITRKTFLAAVMRIYEPGAQFDTMLTLKGPQGCGKSSFFRKLSKGWFSDSLKDIKTKDALEGLQGVWIIEMGELSALRKADAEVIKSFLSGTVDRFRAAYGRRTVEYPRQCIFVATTNECEFLRDRTGNRRFWIAEVPKGAKPRRDVFAIKDEDIDQLWAEAKALYDAHVETVVLTPALAQQALDIQEQYLQDDPRAARIREFLDRLLPENWNTMSLPERQDWLASDEVGTVRRTRVCAAEIWCEALGNSSTERMRRFDAVEINQILDSLPGWTRAKSSVRFPIYGKAKAFVRS